MGEKGNGLLIKESTSKEESNYLYNYAFMEQLEISRILHTKNE